MDVTSIQFIRVRDAVKMSKILLHSICIFTSIGSFLLWVIPPFVTQNQTVRIGSLLLGISLSVTGLISGYKLKQHDSLYKALDLAEKTAFNNYLAQETYLPELGSTEAAHIYIPENEATYPDETLKPEILPEGTSTSTSEEFSASLILEVGREVSKGSSDSFIIQEVLQCKGRKYQQGKIQLAEIKSIIEELNSAQYREV
ncbi:MAG: hypothetical protein F6K48_15930 [Okeania sp. SIO3H1]|nr:hypothetical protein [Okeania sp. SIO3H1]